MQVFICDGCNKQHETENIDDKYITICDGCKLPIKGSTTSCVECNDATNGWNDIDYHKACVVKIDGGLYCHTHKAKQEQAAQAGLILQKYAQEFWGQLGGNVIEFKQKRNDSMRRDFKVEFEALVLTVNLTVHAKGKAEKIDISTTNEITDLNYYVTGIKNHGGKNYKASIHAHETALEEVGSAILRSLYSKKSALTVEKKLLTNHKSTKSELDAFYKKRSKIVKMSKFLAAKLKTLKQERLKKDAKAKVQEAVLETVIA